MKKVLMVVGSMNVGGIENYIMTILRNIDRENINIELLYTTEENCYYDSEIKNLGYKIRRITGRSVSIKKHIQEMKKLFENYKYDIIHINYGTATCMIDAMVAKKYGIKTIVHSHNSNGCNKYINNLFKLALNRYVDVMLACSEEAKKWMFLSKYYTDVKIIKNAIDTKKYAFNESKRKLIRKELNLEDEDLCLGVIARFNEQKNHKYILSFIKLINRKYKMILIGDGNLKKEFSNRIKELGIKEKIIFTGNVSNPQDYLSAIDILLMPSLYEGFPVSLVEAQCSGLDCIISNKIDKKVDLTGNISFIGISETDSIKWAEEINNKKIYRDKNAKQKIIDSGFDIDEALLQLYQIYEVK